MVWTCHEERPRICGKKDDRNGVAGKEEKRKTKEKIFGCGEGGYEGGWWRPRRRFLDVVKEDMKEVGIKETDVEDRMV